MRLYHHKDLCLVQAINARREAWRNKKVLQRGLQTSRIPHKTKTAGEGVGMTIYRGWFGTMIRVIPRYVLPDTILHYNR
jgi:hypothetical protein